MEIIKRFKIAGREAAMWRFERAMDRMRTCYAVSFSDERTGMHREPSTHSGVLSQKAALENAKVDLAASAEVRG